MTLMEIVIVIAISTIVMSIGYVVLNKSYTVTNDQINITNIQNGINITRNLLTDDLKYCNKVYLEYTEYGNEIKVDLNDISSVDEQRSKLALLINNPSNYLKEYRYNIVYGDDYEKGQVYKLKIYEKNKDRYYSLYRESKDDKIIEILSNQKISESGIPLDIVIKNKDKIYSVTLNYLNRKKGRQYTFDIYNESININSNI